MPTSTLGTRADCYSSQQVATFLAQPLKEVGDVQQAGVCHSSGPCWMLC